MFAKCKHLFDNFFDNFLKILFYFLFKCVIILNRNLGKQNFLRNGDNVMAEKKITKDIPRASFPEQVGIDRNEIKALIDDFDHPSSSGEFLFYLRRVTLPG